MRRLVYTCVAGGYDRVYPPVTCEPGIDYIIFTDEPNLCIKGWRTHVVDKAQFSSSRLMNRYFKMLAHREYPNYEASLYVDGNIRVLGGLSQLFDGFQATGAAFGFFRHPLRETVAEEVNACIEAGKADSQALMREQADYQQDGFSDDIGLIEATIILKRHGLSTMDETMSLWWVLFQRYQTRDQVSLPYVLWKKRPSVTFNTFNFRQKNQCFGLYPHFSAAHVRPYYAHLCARSYDSLLHKVLLQAWELSWAIKRQLRQLR